MAHIPESENVTRTAAKTAGPLKRVAKLIILVSLILVVVTGVTFAYLYQSSHAFEQTVNAVIAQKHTPEAAFPNRETITLLLMGRDQDRDERGRVVQTRGRADTIMLAQVDFASRTVNILSIPRDTLVKIPGYRGKRRISHAHALGGADLARRTVSDFLGVHPEYFLVVDFDGFEKAIDELGGVEITVDKHMNYDDNWGNLHIHLEPGKQVLDGYQAMGFVRYRQSNDGQADCDLVRIARQQQLLEAVGEKVSQPGTMFRVPKVLGILRDDIEGNLTSSQIICLARFLTSLSIDSDIRMETLPSLSGGGVFVRADPDAAEELVKQMFVHDRQ